MPFQSAPDCAEAVIQATVSSSPMNNVLNFRKPGGYVQADIDNLADAVDSCVATYYRPFMAAGTTYVQTLVRGLTSAIDLTATNATGAGAGSHSGSVEMPSNTTLCIKLGTGLTGRSARGRFYSFPGTEACMAAQDLFTSAYGNGIVAFLTAVQAAAGAFNWDFVVLSRFTLGAKRTTAISNPITSIAYRNLIVDSQRGRLPSNH